MPFAGYNLGIAYLNPQPQAVAPQVVQPAVIVQQAPAPAPIQKNLPVPAPPQVQAPPPQPVAQPLAAPKKDLPKRFALDQAGYHDSGGAPYSPLLYDPTYLHTPCETYGRYYVAQPDLYGKVWLLLWKGQGGTDIYDLGALGHSDALRDAANGVDNSDACEILPNAYPNAGHPNAVMFSSQRDARQAWMDTVQNIYGSIGLDLYTDRFYCPIRMPFFDPARDGTSWESDAYDWRPNDPQVAIAFDPSNAGRWNFNDNGAFVSPVPGPGFQRDDRTTLIGPIGFYFQDTKTGDQWTIEAFGDTVTRTAYVTAMQNLSLIGRLNRQCRQAQFNWLVSLITAIAETIKGILNIIVGILTFNIGAITNGVNQIVKSWYDFANADEKLHDAEGQSAKGLTPEEAKQEFINIATGGVKPNVIGGNPLQTGPLLTPPSGSGTSALIPLVLVAGGATLILAK